MLLTNVVSIKVIIFWFVPLILLIRKLALGCMCRKRLMVLEDRQDSEAGFPSGVEVKQTELRHFLLPGFGNRCIQPKGPRRPPLEWTWWNNPAARPPPLSSLVRRWGLPTSPGWSKNQDDRCYAFHRNTFWVTVCQYPPLPPPPPPQSSLQSATVLSRDSQEARMFSSSACWCWQVWLL